MRKLNEVVSVFDPMTGRSEYAVNAMITSYTNDFISEVFKVFSTLYDSEGKALKTEFFVISHTEVLQDATLDTLYDSINEMRQ